MSAASALREGMVLVVGEQPITLRALVPRRAGSVRVHPGGRLLVVGEAETDLPSMSKGDVVVVYGAALRLLDGDTARALAQPQNAADAQPRERVRAACEALGLPSLDPWQIVTDSEAYTASLVRVRDGSATAKDDLRIMRGGEVSIDQHAALARLVLHLLGDASA